MYKLIFPTKDTTLYSRHPDRNTGVDQILELTKITSGSAIDDLVGQFHYGSVNYISRILVDFDLRTISQSIVTNGITNPEFYLTIKATEAVHTQLQYTVYANPISGSWRNGTGYYNSDAEVTNGASWTYRDGMDSGRTWHVAGGDYYSGSQYDCTQSFNTEVPDIRMNVTKIVRLWLSGSIPQQGFIVKHDTTAENDDSVLGKLMFFSKDTHTVYIPRLEMFGGTVDMSGTSSISVVSGDDYVVYLKNLRESYREQEVTKIRIGVRQRFPTITYSTSSAYLSTNRLPTDTFFQIMDSVTDEVLVPFHDPGTRVNCDTTGNYIVVDMDTLLPERYYKLVFKTTTSDGMVNFTDENYAFKVYRV